MAWKKKLSYTLIGVAIVAGFIFLISPPPVSVEVTTITTGPLQITVEEDGETRESSDAHAILGWSVSPKRQGAGGRTLH